MSDDMHFQSVEACNFHAREIVMRYGHQVNQKDWGVAYCVPRLVDEADVKIY